jgi:hypothetical protein
VKLASHVRWKELDGVIYVLDLVDDLYLALDPDLSEAWIQVFTGRAGDRVGDLVFRAELERRRWLVERPVSFGLWGGTVRWLLVCNAVRSARPALTLRAWLCLVLVTVSLRVQGLARTYQVVRLIGKRRQSAAAVLEREEAIERFLTAERFFITGFGTNDCLPRSLALYTFLTGVCSIPAEHQIGIKRFPFTAHAWASVDGVPCVDAPHRLGGFSALSTLPD